jgi:hypothetical protein
VIRRIDADRVVRAYRKTGMTVMPTAFFFSRDPTGVIGPCGCAQGAVTCAEKGAEAAAGMSSETFAGLFALDPLYSIAFSSAFSFSRPWWYDGDEDSMDADEVRTRNLGRVDGHLARNAVARAFPGEIDPSPYPDGVLLDRAAALTAQPGGGRPCEC